MAMTIAVQVGNGLALLRNAVQHVARSFKNGSDPMASTDAFCQDPLQTKAPVVTAAAVALAAAAAAAVVLQAVQQAQLFYPLREPCHGTAHCVLHQQLGSSASPPATGLAMTAAATTSPACLTAPGADPVASIFQGRMSLRQDMHL
jgi:hypothetical protein